MNAEYFCRADGCGRSFEKRGVRNYHEGRMHPDVDFTEARLNAGWEENEDGCWIWQFATSQQGYGVMRSGGENRRSHRVSYELHVGPLDDDLQINHKCHVEACVNPDHLYQGTHKDNMQDASEAGSLKGGRYGEDAQNAKLTEDAVRDIRERYAATDITQTEIAGEYGVDPSLISLVVNRRKWAHVE